MIDAVIEELQNLLNNAKDLENRYLGEVLALEKLINHTHKSIPFIPHKQNNKQLQKNQKNQNFQITVDEKIKALMYDIEIRQKNIESSQNQAKTNKFQIKQAQIIIEKKPPIPTANRNEKAIKNHIPIYAPPKNKNQVTGKVTQTVMRTSAQKTFKPQKTSTKKIQIKQDLKNKTNARQNSIEKKAQKKESKIEPIKVEIKPQSFKNQIKVEVKRQNISSHPLKQPQVKKQVLAKDNRVKFATFQKSIDLILSQLVGDTPKNHKKQLQKLIIDCQTEQKGHKMHEDSNRRIFIKKANNYASSRHAVYPMSSFQISRKKWQYQPKLKDFHLLLDSLVNQLENLEMQKDCRIDKKLQFKITESNALYNKIIAQIRDNSQNSQVPQKLQLNFTFTQQYRREQQNESSELQQLSEIDLNNKLLDLLSEISEKGTLQRSQLRGLQALSQVGMFRSKRCPVLVMRKQYQGWKQHYNDANPS